MELCSAASLVGLPAVGSSVLVAAAGLIAAAVFAWAAWSHLAGITTPTDPAQWPLLPLAPVLALAIACTPALTAPRLPQALRPVHRREKAAIA